MHTYGHGISGIQFPNGSHVATISGPKHFSAPGVHSPVHLRDPLVWFLHWNPCAA
jgi:hypothetical protein